jgi:hypothetical protein
MAGEPGVFLEPRRPIFLPSMAKRFKAFVSMMCLRRVVPNVFLFSRPRPMRHLSR